MSTHTQPDQRSAFQRQQDVLQQMPDLMSQFMTQFQTMNQQFAQQQQALVHLTKRLARIESHVKLGQQSAPSQASHDTLQATLDALLTESRVTNLLLADMVSIHRTVIPVHEEELSQTIQTVVRDSAYRQILDEVRASADAITTTTEPTRRKGSTHMTRTKNKRQE